MHAGLPAHAKFMHERFFAWLHCLDGPPKHPCTADTCVVRYALFLRAANAPYPFMGTGSMFALHHVYTVMVLDVHYFGV